MGVRVGVAVGLGACLLVPGRAGAGDWPQWRGPEANGVSRDAAPPVRWTSEENVTWKLALPEWSGSTPIIAGERIFLNVAEGDALSLWCVSRKDGQPLWKRPLGTGNVKMRKQNMSSPSPVTDGKTVVALTGTGVLKAFDLEGKERWTRDLQAEYGKFGLNWGYASSPLFTGGSVYVQVLHGMKTDDPSYVVRIDAATGKNLWKVERPTEAVQEAPDAYTTPLVVQVGKGWELVITGGDCVTGHDPETGKELWRANGLNPTRDPWYRIVASPVAARDVVIAPTRVKPLLALRAGGRGDVSTSHRLWSFENGPDVPTPIVDGTHVYVVNDKGIVWCLELATGKEVYGQQRLKPGTYSASPVLAGGHIYATSEEGLTSVLKAGPTFEVVAENHLEDYTLSSPAVSDGQLFLRTAKHLYCIGVRK